MRRFVKSCPQSAKCDTGMWECETAARGGDTFDLGKAPAGARGGRERSGTFSAFGGGKRIASGEETRVFSDMTENNGAVPAKSNQRRRR